MNADSTDDRIRRLPPFLRGQPARCSNCAGAVHALPLRSDPHCVDCTTVHADGIMAEARRGIAALERLLADAARGAE
jgi:hypothetical protein